MIRLSFSPDGCRDGDAAGDELHWYGMDSNALDTNPFQWIGMDTIRMDTNPLSAGGADAAADTVDEQDRMLPLARRRPGNGPEVPAYARAFAAR